MLRYMTVLPNVLLTVSITMVLLGKAFGNSLNLVVKADPKMIISREPILCIQHGVVQHVITVS